MRKKIILSLITCSTLPLVAFSCSKTHTAKNIFIIEKNEANNNYNNVPKLGGIYAKRNSLHDSLSGNYLLRYKYIGEAKYDYLNNYFFADGISAKYLKFGLINKIQIIDNNQNISVFDSDDDIEFKVPKNLIKRDINRGFKNYIYSLVSPNPRSINSQNFTNKLQQAKSIKFYFKPNQFWFDKQGKQTQFKVLPNDLLNSLRNANLNEQQTQNLTLFGFDINLVSQNNFTNDYAQFNISKIDNIELFLNEIIENKLFSAYKPNYYAGAFYLSSNDLKHTKYIALTNSDIKQVIIKYNPAGQTDNQTHRIHILNEYEQGLVSSQDISIFNDAQQNNLIRKFKSGNKNIKLNILKTKNDSQNKYLSFNLKPNSSQIDPLYRMLMYGTNNNSGINWNHFYQGLGFEFRNNITQIINKFSLNFIVAKTQYYDNFISPDANISNAKNTNYLKIIDAIDHINENALFLDKKIYKYYAEQNKNHFFSKDSYLDIYKQLQSPWYSSIKNNITRILNKFYLTLNNEQKSKKIHFVIPLNIQKIETKMLNILNEIFNSIDPRLVIKIVDLNNNLTKQYYSIFNINSQNTIDYLVDLIEQQNLLNAFKYVDIKLFPNLKKFAQFMHANLEQQDLTSKNKNLTSKLKKAVFDFHTQFNYFDIIKIINEIKILYSVPYNIDSNVDLANFKYELIQPWFSKPTREDELIYFEDIKLRKD
ncbi:hypothetical protein EG856_01320 [Mycoplasmopsis phocirhinis]|uniref:Lipoprotein n=1 Tax=Mycoplasmopsis phocirhinis TaxID=142650 RepID=A0A4P6MLR6_9BACT|nr:hypothetical protein [Mycoplasmopsis phocirhinis]QBF34565.1 hypothetical protein EG856_01320 [Mycoplasmopsis phocirhinis]